MAKRKANGKAGGGPAQEVNDYRHKQAKRKNNPPAKIAAEGTVPAIPRAKYEYNPHLPPVLRFDPNAAPDKLPKLLEKAGREKLSAEELALLAAALRKHEPWLEWTRKREAKSFEVDPVALHIHERISAQAILKVAARQDVEKSLFGGGAEQAYHEAVQFYRHDIDWTNRLILGDSLAVMSSLAKREDLAGKVQMIYIDPPYGIKFASNFQPEIGRRDVKDKEQDLTREPEMVKAYRDTWNLGIHSYLSYLRERILVAKELLSDSGSIFLQISDENLHHVRELLTEVFGAENFVAVINVAKTSGLATAEGLAAACDYLLWFAKKRDVLRYRQIFIERDPTSDSSAMYSTIELPSGERIGSRTARGFDNGKLLRLDNLTKPGPGSKYEVEFEGRRFTPGARWWGTTPEGMARGIEANRIGVTGNNLGQVRYWNDFAYKPLNNLWADTGTGGFLEPKLYVVQTRQKIVERCLLMTTDPGDLVLDPTCGSGTTAFVAEQWGRRWITIDTSRVSISIGRQRLLTGRFEYFKLKDAATKAFGYAQRQLNGSKGAATQKVLPVDDPESPARGFVYKAVPHVTLGSIAQNVALDPIFAKYEPILEQRLKAANAALEKVSREVRAKLEGKSLLKERNEGKKSITDADRRRWLLPPENRDRSEESKKKSTVDLNFRGWYHWEVPFDTDPDWPKALAEGVSEYRKAWRAKMDEVNACIAASAEQEELVDQPEVIKGVVRVSGPFTVEAVQPPEMSLGDVIATGQPELGMTEAGFDGAPEEVGPTFAMRPVEAGVGQSAQDLVAYLDKMVKLLRMDGVRFPNNKQMKFSRLEPIFEQRSGQGFHAEGRWVAEGETDGDPQGAAAVGVVIGPQYGPVTAKMIEELIRPASRRYEALVVAGFSFTGEAQAIIEENPHPKLRIHVAHIRPDVNPGMEGLLKEQPGSQLFTVFGQPRITVKGPNKAGEYTVEMEGVDIYNPVENSITPTGADKVAAWFIDGDYDGRTFCITQAFFPDKSAWEKLSRALNGKDGLIDAERFEALSGTVSLPFPARKHKAVAVKVIDPRGNEVMRVEKLK